MFELNAVLSSFLNNVLLFVTYIQGISVCMFENVRDYNTCKKKLYENLESQSTLNKNYRLSHIKMNPDFVKNFNSKECILAK